MYIFILRFFFSKTEMFEYSLHRKTEKIVCHLCWLEFNKKKKNVLHFAKQKKQTHSNYFYGKEFFFSFSLFSFYYCDDLKLHFVETSCDLDFPYAFPVQLVRRHNVLGTIL